jgi:hypothetical protein
MKREDVIQLTDNAIEELTAALEQGRSESLLRYLQVMAKFHHYSFGNTLLIHWQRPDATHVAGFHAWKKLGRSVIKGEHGIGILAPMVSRVKRDTQPEQDDQAEGALNARSSLRGFRVVHVFDVSQTEGKALASFSGVSGSPGEHLERLKGFIASQKIELGYEYLFGGALGCSEGGRISVRPGLDPAEEFSVLVHELAHELLHKDQATRPATKRLRETEAEAVAFVVSHGVGVDCCTKSSDYIQLWQGNKELLLGALERIRRAATLILQGLGEGAELQAEDTAVSAAA